VPARQVVVDQDDVGARQARVLLRLDDRARLGNVFDLVERDQTGSEAAAVNRVRVENEDLQTTASPGPRLRSGPLGIAASADITTLLPFREAREEAVARPGPALPPVARSLPD
jgi:hypothetical protein